ncbi:TonB-dependent siderophore receptor [Acinetobacter rathckeae]|uniref:TonB-dependent siderophore receptor n=1 Tax=Acinetobacter rathckeae TaxID=2605272 RepID=UPI0018A30B17|nr:TonB-dependent siderophore receptor [Acinetobacter rathckeae]MBF7687887.1 TonB-dependent siderophore receptor [Acinetobacter rathckeae]MBF7687890.1 TonB-dependent siderophore receptor [Acinetobacter rathckeae]
MQVKRSFLALSILATTFPNVYAASENSTVLPSIQAQAEKNDQDQKNYAAKTASVVKTGASLFETAQSISVVTQQQIEEKQMQSVTDALQGVAGVNSAPYGRRGWDDFIIRGQISSAQTYVDGLRTQTSTNVLRSEDIAGVQSVEVVKGPTSVGYGLALPGGLVNLTTKRPEDKTFVNSSLTYGSYALREAVIDANYAPNEDSNKGAVRLVAKASYQNDPTDYVYFKNQYVATSYNFDLGDKDELSVIASYQHRNYIRNQGIPSNYQGYSRKIFIGEPDRGYDVDVYRFGSNYTHYFNNNWKFNQNFAATRNTSWSNSVFSASGAKFPTITRQINYQDKQDSNFALDQNLQANFNLGAVNYDVMLGVDMMRERSDYYQRVDTINSLNANKLVYGVTSIKTGTPSWNLTYNQYTGLYLKNNFKFNDSWLLNLSARHDWTQVKVYNFLKNSTIKNSDNAFTGSASLMYEVNDHFAPYTTYSTSFMPVTDTGAQGELLKPEQGKQIEAGVKLQGFDGRLQGYMAYYDLVRKNVTETSTTGTYSIQTGEQTTKGFEAELSAAITPQLNVSAAYSYIPTAKITDSITKADIGKRINHVPKNAASLSTQYYFDSEKMGWNIGGGVRYQGNASAQRTTYYVYIPSYTLFDVNAGYEAKHWAANLSVKNLFDKEYIQGTTPNAQLINFGNPRTFMFNLKFKY